MNKPPTIIKYLLPRLRDILFIAIFTSIIIRGPGLFNSDGDLGRHITIGNFILDQKTIPTTDVFSHTMDGEPLIPHEWLSQILLALSHRIMGLSGDVLLAALVISITFWILYQELLRRGNFHLLAVLITLWAAAAASIHWLARPHIFTFLFTALWICLLERVYKGEQRKAWILPFLMLIWANMHGAFIAGFVIWGAYLVDWLWERLHGRSEKGVGRNLLLIGVFSLASTFINPTGWHLWQTSIGYVGNDYLVDHTVEYMAPDFHERMMWPFLLMIIFALFSLTKKHRLQLREVLLLAGWAAMGLYSARNIPLFAIITAPTYAMLAQSWIKDVKILKRTETSLKNIETNLRGILWPIITVCLLGAVLWMGIPIDRERQGNQYNPSKFPVEAANWLQENPQEGNMFNYFPWGGYLLYRLWPQQSVFIDGQTDFYGEALTREYEQVITLSENWSDPLKKYSVTWIIIPEDSALTRMLELSSEWNVIYEDETTVIFGKVMIDP